MRHVNRHAVAIPPSLMGPASPASRELERATEHYLTTPEKEFDFTVYSADDVRNALRKLFHGKCAYCESIIEATQPIDIEHFRPKGRIHECPTHPGYWWLAAMWENLLSCCIDCNRRRYQDATKLAGEAHLYERGGRILLGKGDRFPILGPAYAQTEIDDLDAEDAALINPTCRDPKQHLQWLIRDGKNLIGPIEKEGQVDQYGNHSYKVFGLNRQGLVEQRTAWWLRIQAQLVDVQKMLELGVTLPEPGGKQMRDLAFTMLERLREYARPSEPYSAMVEELLGQETEKLLARYGP